MKKKFSYDKENDILFIHKGFEEGDKFKGNIDIGDIILDLSAKGKIRGVEVLNASRFFSDLVEKKTFLELTGADFKAVLGSSGIILKMFFKFKGMKEKVPARIAVPLEAPVER